jgi:mono/diheme cytochrome c family protein
MSERAVRFGRFRRAVHVGRFCAAMRLARVCTWLAIAGAAAAWNTSSASPPSPATVHFADADNATMVAAGKLIYKSSCASCHGRRLQGQPLWQLQDQFAGRRAPAHDQTGHTWGHSDEDLFHMTLDGRFPSTPSTAPSHMPAFRNLLTEQQIIATIAFIKATWPIGLRISQAMLNPGNRGMPAHAADLEWTLPPTCTISAQRWRTTSR